MIAWFVTDFDGLTNVGLLPAVSPPVASTTVYPEPAHEPADQPLVDAALQHGLEQPPQQVAVAEATMAVLREGRVVGHVAVEVECKRRRENPSLKRPGCPVAPE